MTRVDGADAGGGLGSLKRRAVDRSLLTVGEDGGGGGAGYGSLKAEMNEYLALARGARNETKITARQQAGLIEALGDPTVSAIERLNRARTVMGLERYRYR